MDKPIAVVQHQPSVPPSLVTEVLFDRGPVVIVEAFADPEWPQAKDLAGVVVMGGTMNVDQLDDYPFLKSSRELMTDALEQDVPVLGVCLGSQMLARVLGAEVRSVDPRNVSFAPLEVTDEGRTDPLVGHFEGVPAMQFHEDTFEMPSGAVLLASSKSSTGTHQAFRYGDNAYGIQFHFEVDAPIVAGWCRAIGAETMEKDWGTSEQDLLRDTTERFAAQRAAGKDLLESFLNL